MKAANEGLLERERGTGCELTIMSSCWVSIDAAGAEGCATMVAIVCECLGSAASGAAYPPTSLLGSLSTRPPVFPYQIA